MAATREGIEGKRETRRRTSGNLKSHGCQPIKRGESQRDGDGDGKGGFKKKEEQIAVGLLETSQTGGG